MQTEDAFPLVSHYAEEDRPQARAVWGLHALYSLDWEFPCAGSVRVLSRARYGELQPEVWSPPACATEAPCVALRGSELHGRFQSGSALVRGVRDCYAGQRLRARRYVLGV